MKPVFENVSCSQCGREFGPGNHGYSHCFDHMERGTYKAQAKALADEVIKGLGWHYPENHPDRDRAANVLAEFERFEEHFPNTPMVEQSYADELAEALDALVKCTMNGCAGYSHHEEAALYALKTYRERSRQ